MAQSFESVQPGATLPKGTFGATESARTGGQQTAKARSAGPGTGLGANLVKQFGNADKKKVKVSRQKDPVLYFLETVAAEWGTYDKEDLYIA